jgi:hypothetical protein
MRPLTMPVVTVAWTTTSVVAPGELLAVTSMSLKVSVVTLVTDSLKTAVTGMDTITSFALSAGVSESTVGGPSLLSAREVSALTTRSCRVCFEIL